VEQEQKPRERSFTKELVPDWRPTRRQVLWTIQIVIMFATVLGVLTLIGLPFDIALWNWMDLLIIPAVLAAGGHLFTRSKNRATRLAAENRAQDDALQAYLDQIGQLMLDRDRPLRQSQDGDEVRTLARARTLTVLGRLDGNRKESIVAFLYESNLIVRNSAVVDLSRAPLSGADLSALYLMDADLHGST
jgi:hypothetical protein